MISRYRKFSLAALSLTCLLSGFSAWPGDRVPGPVLPENCVDFAWPSVTTLQESRGLRSSTFRDGKTSKADAFPVAFPPTHTNGYQPTSFKLLSLSRTWIDDGKVRASVPDSVKCLHDKKVALRGYAFPLFQTASGSRVILLFSNPQASQESLEPNLQNWCCVFTNESSPIPPGCLLDTFGILRVEPTVIGGHLCCLYTLQSATVDPVSNSR